MYVSNLVVITLIFIIVLGEGYGLNSNNFSNVFNTEDTRITSDTTMEYIKSLGGAYIDLAKYKTLPVVIHDSDTIENLPESFDPRDKWPNCPTLNEIRDQGQCGACWAFGAVEAMTDRVCIYSNGTKNFHFSAEDIISCNSRGSGCRGNDPALAWEKWVEEGLVSGGNYNSHQGCKPYSFATCANHMKRCTNWKPTPPCTRKCEDGYSKSYDDDKKRGKKYYAVKAANMMAEMYINGPVEATFLVYQDFADYNGGVYQYVRGDLVFGHAVKLMGWGVEDGTKYWLAANSWGTDFGDNGFFKIRRGVNECGIESYVFAGEPMLEDY